MISIDLIYLFLLSALGSLIGNLKVITLTKEGYQKYIITLIDSVVYGFLIGRLSSNKEFLGVVFYTLGRLVALFLTDLITKRMYIPIFVLNVYLKEYNSEKIQEYCLKQNLSFTRFKGDFLNESRNMLTIHVNERQRDLLIEELKNLGIENPNIDIREVKVLGKIKERTK